MADASNVADLARGFSQMPGRNKMGTMLGAAVLIALVVGSWLWGTTPEYRVLFSNIADRDGGSVIAALNQMNVPYKMSDGGGAILVPEKLVHDTRLKLASQGLPKGSIVGFEVMESQKLGTTQFQEQVNYQRALEGELARSVQSLSAVATARVHLAIPKPSVFLRDNQKPSASIIVTLHAGRTLERAQVAGITHLVSSSVPELALKAVSVLDQNGNLLSSNRDSAGGLDSSQLGYVQQIEAATIKRIVDILEPIVGRANVRAQVTAELDFSQSESTAETFKPNATPENAVVRSEQKSESIDQAAAGARGVPGALSNQPPAGAAAAAGTGAVAAVAQATGNTRKDSTVNYEIDKTVRHVKNPVGTVKRLSVAVVVNHRKVTDTGGKAAYKPLTPDEISQITALTKEAMGYTQARGDTLNLANAAFSVAEPEIVPELPLWQQPESLSLVRDLGKALLIGIVSVYLLFGVVRPLIRTLSLPVRMEPAFAPALAEVAEDGRPVPGHAERITSARQLAKSDPKMVANVVKSWVSADE